MEKKTLPEALAAELKPEQVRERPVRLCFQDEARFGRMVRFHRCWAPRPLRPKVYNGYEREFVYVYGAVSPLEGEMDWMVCKEMNTERMGCFLEQVSTAHPEDFILMVVDGRYRIGTTAMLTEHNSRCIAQSHLRIISAVRREKLDPYELLFALNLPSVKLRLRSLVFIQSTLGTLGNRLLELRIPVLHGDGAWTSRVSKFRDTLQRRSALLADLSGMSGQDYEL